MKSGKKVSLIMQILISMVLGVIVVPGGMPYQA